MRNGFLDFNLRTGKLHKQDKKCNTHGKKRSNNNYYGLLVLNLIYFTASQMYVHNSGDDF